QTTNRQWINFFLALQSTTFKLLRRLGFDGFDAVKPSATQTCIRPWRGAAVKRKPHHNPRQY
ncbi:MAG: hypothetical protein ACN6PR_11885, partial [Achromobacter sp.]